MAQLPPYGGKFKIRSIRYNDLAKKSDLVKVFSRFDDTLHQAGHDLEERYTILLQILLVKIYDEHLNRPTNGRMVIQDFSVMAPGSDVTEVVDKALGRSLDLYQKYLPKNLNEDRHERGDPQGDFEIVLSSELVGFFSPGHAGILYVLCQKSLQG